MRTIGRFSVASVISVILGFSRFGVFLGLLVAVGLTVLLPFRSPNVTVTVPVSFSLDDAAPIRAGRPGFGFEILDPKDQARADRRARIDRVNGSLRIPSATKPVIAVNSLILIATLAFLLFVLGQVHAVFRSLTSGPPFVPANATRIQRVGLAVIAGELTGAMIISAESYYARTHVAIAGLTFDAVPRIDFVTIGYGLVILVIAEVFRAGTRLDEEQSLTI